MAFATATVGCHELSARDTEGCGTSARNLPAERKTDCDGRELHGAG